MLRAICEAETELRDEEILRLEEVERQLPLMAELTGADVFIDCVTREGKAVVAAHARPFSVDSVYSSRVAGQLALEEKEPAVYRAMRLRTPVRELKALTQEGRNVRQDVVPILDHGRCIAVLIREKDISVGLRQEKKFEQLARSYEAEDLSLRSEHSGDTLAMREVHHRVKNDLQLVASILNLQSRRCGDPEAGQMLKENVGRVLSIASIHDILTKTESDTPEVDSMTLLRQLCQNLRTLIPGDRRIQLEADGTSAPLSGSVAGSMALVVNELVTNAVEHAFEGREEGHIRICFEAGTLTHTVTVTDDGCGFDPDRLQTSSLGLRIAEATVKDRLHGRLRLHSDGSGSIASFDIQTI